MTPSNDSQRANTRTWNARPGTRGFSFSSDSGDLGADKDLSMATPAATPELPTETHATGTNLLVQHDFVHLTPALGSSTATPEIHASIGFQGTFPSGFGSPSSPAARNRDHLLRRKHESISDHAPSSSQASTSDPDWLMHEDPLDAESLEHLFSIVDDASSGCNPRPVKVKSEPSADRLALAPEAASDGFDEVFGSSVVLETGPSVDESESPHASIVAPGGRATPGFTGSSTSKAAGFLQTSTPTSIPSFQGFSTGAGKAMTRVSSAAIQSAAAKFADVLDEPMPRQLSSMETSAERLGVDDSDLVPSEGPESSGRPPLQSLTFNTPKAKPGARFTGFATGTGRALQPSSKGARDRVKQLFGDDLSLESGMHETPSRSVRRIDFSTDISDAQNSPPSFARAQPRAVRRLGMSSTPFKSPVPRTPLTTPLSSAARRTAGKPFSPLNATPFKPVRYKLKTPNTQLKALPSDRQSKEAKELEAPKPFCFVHHSGTPSKSKDKPYQHPHWHKHTCTPEEAIFMTAQQSASYRFSQGHRLDAFGAKEARDNLVKAGGGPNLATSEWVSNHYRWIVWTLACLVRSFPENRHAWCWETVQKRLLYRYEREINRAQRPSLRKIVERDDVPDRFLILCVAQIAPRNNGVIGWHLELTDGWYGIKASVDEALLSLIQQDKIAVGMKLRICKAQLAGPVEPCPVLEVTDSTQLHLTANGVRRAFWDASLGYQRSNHFVVGLRQVHFEGGLVPCIDVIVCRRYRLRFLEKMPNGKNLLRSAREEEYALAQWQKAYENKLQEISQQVDRDDAKTARIRDHRSSGFGAAEDRIAELHEEVAVRMRMFNMLPTRNEQDARCSLHLRATRNTKFMSLPVSPQRMQQSHFEPREMLTAAGLENAWFGSEMDLVLVVLDTLLQEHVYPDGTKRYTTSLLCTDETKGLAILEVSTSHAPTEFPVLKGRKNVGYLRYDHTYKLYKIRAGANAELSQVGRGYAELERQQVLHSWCKRSPLELSAFATRSSGLLSKIQHRPNEHSAIDTDTLINDAISPLPNAPNPQEQSASLPQAWYVIPFAWVNISVAKKHPVPTRQLTLSDSEPTQMSTGEEGPAAPAVSFELLELRLDNGLSAERVILDREQAAGLLSVLPDHKLFAMLQATAEYTLDPNGSGFLAALASYRCTAAATIFDASESQDPSRRLDILSSALVLTYADLHARFSVWSQVVSREANPDASDVDRFVSDLYDESTLRPKSLRLIFQWDEWASFSRSLSHELALTTLV
ncbi:Breast cancer 2, early onset, partial [Thoreauomyces humboldtii]